MWLLVFIWTLVWLGKKVFLQLGLFCLKGIQVTFLPPGWHPVARDEQCCSTAVSQAIVTPTTILCALVADSPQVSHFHSLFLCFCVLLSVVSNNTAGLWGEMTDIPRKRLRDGSPVLLGSSESYVIHAIKETQTAVRGTEPWEAFPTLLIKMTEIHFLHSQATSMHVEKNSRREQ